MAIFNSYVRNYQRVGSMNQLFFRKILHLPTSRFVLIRCPWPATVASNGRAGRSPKRFTERRSMAHNVAGETAGAALNKNGNGSSGHRCGPV